MCISLFLKQGTCKVAFLCSFVFLLVLQANAQNSSSERLKSESLQPLEKGTRILMGTAGLFRSTNYIPSTDGFEKLVQTRLDIEFRNLRFTGKHFGWGIQALGELFMSGTFGNVGLGTIGLGPVLRGYPWLNDRWHSYIQGGFLIGYDLALGDAIGANRSEGMRYRTGLRAGANYRVSNAFGIFLETGPDWEADDNFSFDSRAWQFNIGIQLFRF